MSISTSQPSDMSSQTLLSPPPTPRSRPTIPFQIEPVESVQLTTTAEGRSTPVTGSHHVTSSCHAVTPPPTPSRTITNSACSNITTDAESRPHKVSQNIIPITKQVERKTHTRSSQAHYNLPLLESGKGTSHHVHSTHKGIITASQLHKNRCPPTSRPSSSNALKESRLRLYRASFMKRHLRHSGDLKVIQMPFPGEDKHMPAANTMAALSLHFAATRAYLLNQRRERRSPLSQVISVDEFEFQPPQKVVAHMQMEVEMETELGD